MAKLLKDTSNSCAYYFYNYLVPVQYSASFIYMNRDELIGIYMN